MQTWLYVILLTVLTLCLMGLTPLAFIWALNELFNLKIAYSFVTWVASFVLLVCLNASVTKR